MKIQFYMLEKNKNTSKNGCYKWVLLMMTQVEYCFVSFKILGARRKHGDKEYVI